MASLAGTRPAVPVFLLCCAALAASLFFTHLLLNAI
jgi:hypothetical protein